MYSYLVELAVGFEEIVAAYHVRTVYELVGTVGRTVGTVGINRNSENTEERGNNGNLILD